MSVPIFAAQRYEDFFDEVDADKDDFISLDDIRVVCLKYGYTGPYSQLQRCFQEADRARNNKLSYEEFMLAMGLTPRPRDTVKNSILRQVFQQFDKDGNGEIDRSELEQVFKELGRHYSSDQVQRMIDLVDKDGTGTLNYTEFLKALESGAQAEQQAQK